MKKTLVLLAFCLVVIWTWNSSPATAQDNSLAAKFIGKWTQQMVGARTGGAIIDITSFDSATGLIRGKYIPPSGPAAGKEFEVIGWVSSAPPRDKQDNVITVSFSVSLTTYGSISSETGYLKDNKIFAMWHNVRPNTAYDWDHVTTGQDIWTRNP